MARTPKNLVRGELSTTTLTTIYTSPAGINSPIKVFGVTNNTETSIRVSVYVGDGTDYLQAILTLPAGIGRNRRFYTFDQDVINSAETVKIQADSASSFNYTLSGAEVEL